jgi:hypothetical protein
MSGRRRQQRPIRDPELGPGDLTAQNIEFLPQHQQLDVLHVQPAATPGKRPKQSPKHQIEEGEGHTADPPNPGAQEPRHRYWRPSRIRRLGTSRQNARSHDHHLASARSVAATGSAASSMSSTEPRPER